MQPSAERIATSFWFPPLALVSISAEMGRLSFLTIYRQNVSILGLPIDKEQLAFNKDRFKNKTKLMKTIRQAIIGAVALSFASAIHSPAITNTAIAISGTNLVLSWPSYGYETYLVQYRQTLDPSDSWSVLTNAYPANSTNSTTFTLYGLVPSPANGGGGGSGNIVGGPPSPSFASSSSMAANSGPLVVPADGTGGRCATSALSAGF